MGSGQWAVNNGQWAVDSGQWAIVTASRQWAVNSGPWTMDSRHWPVANFALKANILWRKTRTEVIYSLRSEYFEANVLKGI